ncbi:hypothetical protein D3C78_1444960 [compost metagenome]
MDMSSSMSRVLCRAWRRAMPRPTAQARMPMKFASRMAFAGLLVTLNSRLLSTSPMPPGGASSWAAAFSTRVDGKAKLAITATTAAEKVPIR